MAMSNIIYGQYDSNKYPLKRYHYNKVPTDIEGVLTNLNDSGLAVFRGGLAFIFILNEDQYMLKDLDMLALKSDKEMIVQMVAYADIVYINENTFGDTVITAFWDAGGEFFKLDILLCDSVPAISVCFYDGKKKKTMSASYIWRNRIEKIAEKEQRKHDDKKTLNHYRVASKLSEYLLKNKNEISDEDTIIVAGKIKDTEMVLNKLISEQEVMDFLNTQDKLLRG